MALDFDKANSKKLVNKVMKQIETTETDNIKRDINIDLIDENKDNEYIFGMDDIEYLQQLIEEDGFNGAIEVYAKSDGRYEISSGHRRLAAMKKKGETKIPCIISSNVNDVTKAKRLIDSNIANRKMTPLRWGRALDYYAENVIKEAQKHDKTIQVRKELAKHFNMSEASVHRYRSLLKLIPEFQKCADTPNFPFHNFLPITKLSNEQQKEIYNALTIELSKKEYSEEEVGMASFSAVYIQQIINKILLKEEKQFTIKDEKQFISKEEIKENYKDATTSDFMNAYEIDNNDIIIKNNEYEEDGMIQYSEQKKYEIEDDDTEALYKNIIEKIMQFAYNIEETMKIVEIKTDDKKEIREKLLTIIDNL